MGAFDQLRIAGSSLGMHQTWLDALANNIANANTVTATSQRAFQAEYVVATSRADGGVEVGAVMHGDAAGRVVSMPNHPLADADGNVRVGNVDMGAEMSELIMAQRGFQASVQVTKNAQENYSSALSIGRA